VDTLPFNKSEIRSTKSETNSKHQNLKQGPNNREAPNNTHQGPNETRFQDAWATIRGHSAWPFVIWNLSFGPCLSFGACDLELALGPPDCGFWNIWI
jgi:hypothetical protein